MGLTNVFAVSEMRSPEEVALANQYANQHERLDNFIFMYAIPSRLLKRLGIALYSGRGYALMFSLFFLVIFFLGLAITAIAGEIALMPPARLALLAATLSVLNVLALIITQAAAYKISALHRLLCDPQQIRALIAWDRRWFGPRISALMGSLISLVFLTILYMINLSLTGIRLPASILWICAVITVFLGQFGFSTSMIYFEFKKLSACRFELYRLNPYDTRAIQQTSAGLKQLGLVATVTLPLFLAALLIVLPKGSPLNMPLTGGFLLIAYLAVGIGIFLPLRYLGEIVKAEKWRLLVPVQARLNQMADQLQTLSAEDYERFTQLQSIYQTIRDTRDSFLSLSAVARIGGTLLLSTATVILPALILRLL